MRTAREQLLAQARSMRAAVVVLVLCALAILAGCGTPLNTAEDAYSVEESTARKSYVIIGTAYVKGKATEEQMAEARQLYDAYFEAQTEVYVELNAAMAEGDVNLTAPGRREKVTQHMTEVTRCAFLLAKLAKEVTK